MSLIMKKDFLVKVAKGSGIVEFTQQHLDTHLRFFNEETKPEYFGDLQPFGLDYDRTVLIEDIIIRAVAMSQQNQIFRKGKNPKYPLIKNSIIEQVGVDLREKPLQVVEDDDGNIEVIFNGNTTNDIFTKYTNLQNRIVAVYKRNSNFSYAKLRLIGGYSNCLDYPSGTLSFADLSKIVKEYLIHSGIIERFKKGVMSKVDFRSEIRDAFFVVSKNTIKPEGKLYYSFINKETSEALGEEDILSATNGVEVMKNLIENFPLKYTDQDRMHYLSISANMDKWFDVLKNKSKSLKFVYDSGNSKIPPSKVNVNVIIHMGEPNPEDPILDFFTKYLGFYKDFTEVHYFLENDYCDKPRRNNRHELIGAYQQVKEIDTLEFGSVVTFDEIIKDYEERYPQGKLVEGIT